MDHEENFDNKKDLQAIKKMVSYMYCYCLGTLVY